MATLENLRHLIGAVDGAKTYQSCSLFEPGFPVGALTQLAGHGKTELMAQFLAEHSSLKVAWLEMNFNLNPIALLQRGVQLERVLFVDCHKDPIWPCLQILKSGLFPVVVIQGTIKDLKPLRRLQLAAEKAQSSVVFLQQHLHAAWPISLQLQVLSWPKENAPSIYVTRQR